jgi:hypothetical protein
MADGSRRTLGIALTTTGGLGLLCAALMMPVAGAFLAGRGVEGLVFMEDHLPLWARWRGFLTIAPTGVTLVVVAVLCVLVAVAGDWPSRAFAAAVAAWFAYSSVTLNAGGTWRLWIAEHGSLVPYFAFTLVSAVALVSLCVVAFVVAHRLRSAVGGGVSNQRVQRMA